MRLLLDHCVWKPTLQALTRAGFSCLTLRELGRAEARNSEVIALAHELDCVLITRDRDFTDLAHYPLGTHRGIVWLEITPASMSEVHQALCQALRRFPETDLTGSLLIVTPTTYRLRRPSS